MFLTPYQKEKIKIIAFDLDGTLLGGDSRLSEHTAEVLNRAADRGYHLVPATGRVFSSLPADLHRLEIRHAVTSNGGCVVSWPDGREIFRSLIAWEDIEPAVSTLMDDSVICEIFFGGSGYIAAESLERLPLFVRDERRREYIRTTRRPVGDLEALMREHRDELENIMLLFADLSVKQAYYDYLSSMDGLSVVFSQSFSLEIGGRHTSKANGLREIAQLYGLGLENVICFGDSTNDIAMLRACGVSAAMGNAIPEVKEAADITAPPNTEDGLAAVVEELLEQG